MDSRCAGSLTPNPSPVARERGTRLSRWQRGKDTQGSYISIDRGRPLPRSAPRMRDQAKENRRTPTRSEHIFWQALRNRRFAGQKFRRQYPIGPFILDFYCPEHRLAVEIDGPIHTIQSEADEVRQHSIESFGVRFVRLPSRLVETNIKEALNQVEAAIKLPSPSQGRGAGGEGCDGQVANQKPAPPCV